jgi:hypothetical protein
MRGEVVVTKLEAIKYLVKNDESGNEWQEAGMWVAVRKVINFPSEHHVFTVDDLKKLIEEAMNY